MIALLFFLSSAVQAAETPRICVAAVLRDDAEYAELNEALGARLSAPELAQLQIRPGVLGFRDCLASVEAFSSVAIVIHGGKDPEGNPFLTAPLSGNDVRIPWSAVGSAVSRSRASRILIAACKAESMRAQFLVRQIDPRVHWLMPSTGGDDDLPLSEAADGVIELLRQP